jgi:hypothetical protein
MGFKPTAASLSLNANMHPEDIFKPELMREA